MVIFVFLRKHHENPSKKNKTSMAREWFIGLPVLLIHLVLAIIPLTCALSQTEALIQLKKSFGANATALSSWGENSKPCEEDNQWSGLLCYNGIVTGLRLENMGLSGKIDVDALIGVSGLRTVSFAHNLFSGTIPELNRLGYLKAIYLTGNKFSGEIKPDFFSEMVLLKKLWLSHNNFTGKIPSSLSQLAHLLELHLEENRFVGTIPAMKQSTLVSFNVSDNDLEGEIPSSLTRFNSTSFGENPNLCGEKIGKLCRRSPTPAPNNVAASQKNHGNDGNDNNIGLAKTAAFITLVTMILSVATMAVIRMRKKECDFETLAKRPNPGDGQVSMSARLKEMELAERTAGSGRKGSIRRKENLGELVMVSYDEGEFGLQDLMKAPAEILGNGGLGSSYKAQMDNGVNLVVKRTREMNALEREEFGEEFRQLGRLRHPNILPPLAFHYRKEEKLVVFQHVPKGSLLFLLHGDRGPSHEELNWSVRGKIIKGIARGMGHLHAKLSSHELPHGNLKSSNVLLNANNEPLLTEFGFNPLIDPQIASQIMFAYKAPEVTHCGVSPKCDVYCLGIIILEVLTGKFPSQYLSNGKGGTDLIRWVESAILDGKEYEMLDPQIASSTDCLSQMKHLLYVGSACVTSNQHEASFQAILSSSACKFNGSASTFMGLTSSSDGLGTSFECIGDGLISFTVASSLSNSSLVSPE